MPGVTLGGVEIDLGRGRVIRGDRADDLTARETDVLRYLLDRNGSTVTRDELEREVWKFAPSVVSEAVPVCIRRLRQKLEDDPSEPQILLTVRGVGWTIHSPDRSPDGWPSEEGLTSRFVGRTAEFEVVSDALRRGVRVVTLAGPPGAGKTRLAHEIGRRTTGQVLTVPLGSARDPEQIAVAVGHAIGLGKLDDPTASVVGTSLCDRGPLLLILDECERLSDAVRAYLLVWILAAPGLQVLVTSRRPLGVEGEQRVPIGPLPDDDAITLFCDRARVLDPSFDGADHGALLAIVSRLDGLPLALELAAANVGVLGVEGLRELVTLGALDLLSPESGRGLDAVLERSIGLLSSEDRAALTALGVFEATFTRDDAARILDGTLPMVVARLRSLFEQGLLRVFPAANARFQLLTVVRERVRRDLDPADPVFHRHAEWFARLGALDISQGMDERWPDFAAARAASADLDAAIGRRGEPDVVARCGLARLRCLSRTGPVAHGVALVAQLRAVPCSRSIRCALEQVASGLLWGGDPAASLDALDHGISLADTARARAILRLTRAARSRYLHDFDRARTELEAIAADVLTDDALHAMYLFVLAGTDPVRHDELQLDAIRYAQRAGATVTEAWCRLELADRAYRQGRWIASAEHVRQSLRVLSEYADPSHDGDHLFLASQIARQQGRLEEADDLLGLAEEALARHGRWGRLHQAKIERALLIVSQGDIEGGERLLRDGLVRWGDWFDGNPILRGVSTTALANVRIVLAAIQDSLGRFAAARATLMEGFDGVPAMLVSDRFGLLALLDGREGYDVTAWDLIQQARELAPPHTRPPHSAARHLGTTSLVAALVGRDLDARRDLEEARRLAAGLGLTDRAPLARFLDRVAAARESQRTAG